MLAKCLSLFIWGGAILFGILLAVSMIKLVWYRTKLTPTLTTVDTYYHPVHNVPFPAVTLCNINIVYRPAMEEMIKKL